MSKNIQPYGLRMPPDLRAKLDNEAKLAGRSLNSEILARLWESVNKKHRHISPAAMDSASSTYQTLSDNEQAMLKLFRRWSPEKQLSFLVLFK